MLSTDLSTDQLREFNKDGYIIVKNFCSQQEVNRLHRSAVAENNTDKNDPNNQPAKKLSLPSWFTPGNDAFGYLARSEKIVKSVARLLGSESPVCHIHSKLMEKVPNTGGVWEWHQDFAYWYTNKFISASKMVSVMVALTPVNKENGCSQIIKGSHKAGRLKHSFEGEKVGADMEGVSNALKTMELVYLELEAGDALFFHSNLLHRSGSNLSDYSTWSNISCYSLQSNLAQKQIFTSWHTPVEVVPDEAITDWNPQTFPQKTLQKKVYALKDTVWGQLVALT